MPNCLDIKIVKEIKEGYSKEINRNVHKKSFEFTRQWVSQFI